MKKAEVKQQVRSGLGMRILKEIHEATYHPCLNVYQLKIAW